jgi:hypothetical protein
MSVQGNGFGNRKPTIRDDMAAQATAQGSGGGISRGISQIGGVTIGIAIVLAVATFYIVSMKSAGRALSDHWAQNAGYPQIDNPPVKRADQGATYNELRTTCKPRAERVQISQAMRQDLDYYPNIWVGEEQVMQHAAFVDCLITEMPTRLCRPEHRAHLVDAVRTYFRMRVKVREEWAMTRNNPFGAHAVGLVAAPGSTGVSARYPSERTDPRIVAGLRDLIAKGYITPTDLGGGAFSRMPGDLAETLKGVERKQQSCG